MIGQIKNGRPVFIFIDHQQASITSFFQRNYKKASSFTNNASFMSEAFSIITNQGLSLCLYVRSKLLLLLVIISNQSLVLQKIARFQSGTLYLSDKQTNGQTLIIESVAFKTRKMKLILVPIQITAYWPTINQLECISIGLPLVVQSEYWPIISHLYYTTSFSQAL